MNRFGRPSKPLEVSPEALLTCPPRMFPVLELGYG